MTREESKLAAEVMNAYSEGKKIQYFNGSSNEWESVDEPLFNWSINTYRVAPEYRPFKSSEECLEEMKKHEPSGLLKCNDVYVMIASILPNYIYTYSGEFIFYEKAFEKYLFADGTPFGIFK